MIKLIKSTFFKEAETKKKLCRFILNSKQLSFDQECEKFECNFARWQGRKYCVLLNSGSSANLAIIQALSNLKLLEKGDLAGFSALTWSTNVMPIIQLGYEPIPVDVDLSSLNVSSKTLMGVLEKYPLKMLFLTNLLGFCSDIDEIKNICSKKGIVLVEDNCESLGTKYQGIKLGNFGLASTFSFYVGHHMSTIEGGAVCTDNEDLATMLRIVRAHGWDRNINIQSQQKLRDKFKVNSTFYSRYTFYDLGFNLRPTEICGYIGNIQLGYLDEVIKTRNKNFLEMSAPIYRKENCYFPINHSHIDFVSNFAVPVICRSVGLRDKLVSACSNKIEIRPVVGGDMTKQPFFNKLRKWIKIDSPNARLVHEQGLYFGNNPELTVAEKETIVKTFTNL